MGHKYQIYKDLCSECGHLVSRTRSHCPFCGWTRDDSHIAQFFSGAESKYRSDRQPLIMETIGDIDRFLDNGVQSFD
jgi:hypothetical protein